MAPCGIERAWKDSTLSPPNPGSTTLMVSLARIFMAVAIMKLISTISPAAGGSKDTSLSKNEPTDATLGTDCPIKGPAQALVAIMKSGWFRRTPSSGIAILAARLTLT